MRLIRKKAFSDSGNWLVRNLWRCTVRERIKNNDRKEDDETLWELPEIRHALHEANK